MSARVLFIVHDNYQDDNVFPLGVGYLAAVLLQIDVEVEVYCMDVFHYSNNELEDFLSNAEFDIIGLGFMAARFKRTIEQLCKVINKNKKKAWFVLGGHGPSPIPEYILETTKADIVVIGEGENTIQEIVECKLSSPDKLSQIHGIVYKKEGQVYFTPHRKLIKNIDDIPFPAWDLFPMESYTSSLKFSQMTDDDKAFPISTARGCVGKCSFCYRLSPGIRLRSSEMIINEMKLLMSEYGINYFFFLDELSIVSKKQILNFTSLILKNKMKIKFRMDCRVDVFDEEIAMALKKAGCVFLNIGFESTNQTVLNLLGKGVTVEQNIRAAEIANKLKIGVGLNFIWGLPGDTERSLKTNVEFIKKYNQFDQVRTIRPVTPFPGSPLYNEAIKSGLLKGPADFFNRFKNSDLYMVNFMGIPEKDIYEMLFEVNKDLINWHYKNTNQDFSAANNLIDNFKKLYFESDYSFRGSRNLSDNKDVRK